MNLDHRQASTYLEPPAFSYQDVLEQFQVRAYAFQKGARMYLPLVCAVEDWQGFGAQSAVGLGDGGLSAALQGVERAGFDFDPPRYLCVCVVGDLCWEQRDRVFPDSAAQLRRKVEEETARLRFWLLERTGLDVAIAVVEFEVLHAEFVDGVCKFVNIGRHVIYHALLARCR